MQMEGAKDHGYYNLDLGQCKLLSYAVPETEFVSWVRKKRLDKLSQNSSTQQFLFAFQNFKLYTLDLKQTFKYYQYSTQNYEIHLHVDVLLSHTAVSSNIMAAK